MGKKEFITEMVQALDSLTQGQYEEVKAHILSRFVCNQELLVLSKFVFRMAEEYRPKLLEVK